MFLRPGKAADIATLAALEQECFSDPWTEEALFWELEHGVVVILEDDEGIAAYTCGYLASDDYELNTFAVAPRCRRRGYGALLLQYLLNLLSNADVEHVYLEVRQSNQPAIDLYLKHGFTVYGTRKKYYDHPVEDALLMKWSPTAGGTVSSD